MDQPRIRAFIVDDSAVARHLLSRALNAEPDMEVVGQADSGESALEQLARDAPDVVVLDLEMPGMDGFETLRILKQRNPGLPVLIFSSQTRRGAGATVDALLAGADDYALKPSGARLGSSAWEASQRELASKLRAITARARRLRPRPAVTPTAPLMSGTQLAPVEAVAIGTSIGGPEALAELLPKLHAGLAVPIFVVQHMPHEFTGALARRLAEKSRLPVLEARHGQAVRPGVAYVAPGDRHLLVSRRHESVALLLDHGPLENGCRPSVDPLFRSAAVVYGAGLLALVLTGMGSDGLAGAEQVRRAGGHVWIQDEHSSTVWGMAGAVARAGLASRSLPLSSMATTLEVALRDGLPSLSPRAGGA